MCIFGNIIESYERIPYIKKHRYAFKITERKLTGKVRHKFHDVDKLVMCILFPYFGWDIINKLHVKLAKHHLEYFRGISKIDKIEALIDWECAHLTKRNKCLSAVDFIKTNHSELYYLFENDIKILNLI